MRKTATCYKPETGCRWRHRWSLLKTTGVNEYRVCRRCGARQVRSYEEAGITRSLIGLLEDRKTHPEWCAAQTLFFVDWTRSMLHDQAAKNAARFAILAKHWFTCLGITQIEEAARFGLEHKRKVSNPKASSDERSRWHSRAEELFRSGQARSGRQAAQIIEAESTVKAETIRKEIAPTIKELKRR